MLENVPHKGAYNILMSTCTEKWHVHLFRVKHCLPAIIVAITSWVTISNRRHRNLEHFTINLHSLWFSCSSLTLYEAELCGLELMCQ